MCEGACGWASVLVGAGEWASVMVGGRECWRMGEGAVWWSREVVDV